MVHPRRHYWRIQVLHLLLLIYYWLFINFSNGGKKIFRNRHINFAEQQEAERILRNTIALLTNPEIIFATDDALEVIQHMEKSHSFQAVSGTVDHSNDGNFVALNGLNFSHTTLTHHVKLAMATNCLKHDFNIFKTDWELYQRTDNGASLHKVN